MELSSLESVRSAARAFQATGLPLHTLICNAAVMALPERRVSVDGFEYQLEVNYLSHFLLVNLLYQQLVAGGTPSDPARVINVSSSAHFVRSPLGFGDVADLNLGGGEGDPYAYYPWTAYGQSKLAQVMFTYELDRRLAARGVPVVAHALDPGIVDSELGRYLPAQAKSQMKSISKRPEQGAEVPVYLATAGRDEIRRGRYWSDVKGPGKSLGLGDSPVPSSPDMAVPGSTSYDDRTWVALWGKSAKLVGLPETI